MHHSYQLPSRFQFVNTSLEGARRGKSVNTEPEGKILRWTNCNTSHELFEEEKEYGQTAQGMELPQQKREHSREKTRKEEW